MFRLIIIRLNFVHQYSLVLLFIFIVLLFLLSFLFVILIRPEPRPKAQNPPMRPILTGQPRTLPGIMHGPRVSLLSRLLLSCASCFSSSCMHARLFITQLPPMHTYSTPVLRLFKVSSQNLSKLGLFEHDEEQVQEPENLEQNSNLGA